MEEIINHIINDRKSEKHQFLDSLAKSLACKKSVRGNEYLSQMQVEYILEDLEKDISPSRTVYASKNQTIIASYPGNGWVYLGEIESKALVGFKGKTFSSSYGFINILQQP